MKVDIIIAVALALMCGISFAGCTFQIILGFLPSAIMFGLLVVFTGLVSGVYLRNILSAIDIDMEKAYNK